MTLPAGSRFGVYEILAPLGAGGMVEVIYHELGVGQPAASPISLILNWKPPQ